MVFDISKIFWIVSGSQRPVKPSSSTKHHAQNRASLNSMLSKWASSYAIGVIVCVCGLWVSLSLFCFYFYFAIENKLTMNGRRNKWSWENFINCCYCFCLTQIFNVHKLLCCLSDFWLEKRKTACQTYSFLQKWLPFYRTFSFTSVWILYDELTDLDTLSILLYFSAVVVFKLKVNSKKSKINEKRKEKQNGKHKKELANHSYVRTHWHRMLWTNCMS